MNEEKIAEKTMTDANEDNSFTATKTSEEAAAESFIPETPDGYQLPVSQTIPFSEEADKSFKELAYKLKLTSQQVIKLGEWANENGERNQNLHVMRMEKFKSDSMAALKNEWGLNCEANIDKAVRTAQSLAENFPEFKNFLDDTGAGNDPRFIKALSKLGDMMSEDSLPYSTSSKNKGSYLGGMPILDFSSMNK